MCGGHADLAAMASIPDHWTAPPDLKTASVAQREIAGAVEQHDRFGPVSTIAGVDTSMRWRDSRGPIHAAVAPMSWPPGEVYPAASVTQVPPIPYVPGYLGFRECPVLLAALQRLPTWPDLVLVDGHGRAHPRRAGIAVQFGVVADLPTIGCAKTLLCGKVVGVALRTRPRAAPIYVSIGHRISLDSAVEWVLKVCDGRRLPLPIRLAHDAANAARRAAESEIAG
jgi:deoxyribonuclease V